MLMIRPIVCDNCNEEVKALPFQLTWKYETKRCKECKNEDDSHRRYEFCSSRCLKLWSNKFHNHKHQWDISLLGSGATMKNGKVHTVLSHCKICKATDWHNKDKKMIDKYKKWHEPYLAMASKLSKKGDRGITIVKHKKKKNDNTRHNKKPISKSKK